MKTTFRIAALVLGLCALTSEARADGYISPFIGVNFGGDAGGGLADRLKNGSKVTWGGDVGWMGGGIFGVELDFAVSNNFFDGTLDNGLWTLVPTAIIGIPIGGQQGLGIRPYGVAGIGVSHRTLDVDGLDVFEGSDAVYTLGAGAMAFFATHFGLRVDYRYMRNFSADDFDFPEIPDFRKDTFNFNRFTGALVFRF